MCDHQPCRRDLSRRSRPGRRILVLVASVVVGLAALAPRPLAASGTDAPRVASPEDVVRAWVAAVNRADAEAAIALYADDAVIEALGQQFRGKPAIARRLRTIIAPVLRPRIEIERLAVDGEAVSASLVGENALTRFDGRGPLHIATTFFVRDGRIQREVGPILSPADAAWYADAMPRFRATGALPQLLPNAGDLGHVSGMTAVLATLLGAALLTSGIVLIRRS